MKYLESNNWPKRFIYASIIQGVIFTGLKIFLVAIQILFFKPEISKVIAAGSAVSLDFAREGDQ